MLKNMTDVQVNWAKDHGQEERKRCISRGKKSEAAEAAEHGHRSLPSLLWA